eukprot:678323-Prymnesium_polylepis.1
MAERDALEGFADRAILDGDSLAPPRRPRRPGGADHFRHHPHGDLEAVTETAGAVDLPADEASDDDGDGPAANPAPDVTLPKKTSNKMVDCLDRA